MERSLRPFLAFMAILLGLLVQAQEITFDATVDRTSVATGDPIKLTLTLTNAPMGSGITPPDLGGLVVVQGPYDQNSFSMINGRTSSSLQRTYYLQAVQPGDFTIGAATARVGGGTIQSKPIKVHVVKGESTGPNNAQLNEAQRGDPNLFCTISLSKSKAYVGEQLVATYTLYSRYNSLQPGDYDLPKLDGFWAEEVDLGETSWEKVPQTINGLRYNVAVLKKQVLFPQRSGKLRIAPMTLNYRVNVSFFNNGTPVRITSNAAEVSRALNSISVGVTSSRDVGQYRITSAGPDPAFAPRSRICAARSRTPAARLDTPTQAIRSPGLTPSLSTTLRWE